MKRTFTIISLLIAIFYQGMSQTQSDTIVNIMSKTAIVVDGAATEECWANAEWNLINQVWLPYGTTMKQGDFEGKFKVAWDAEYFYILVEVVDDMLSDDHSNPTQNWWDDDCLEIFIDEDRSKGNHERNNNAFAYHVSLFYDAIDLNSSGTGINYKNHVNVVMDTIGVDTYLWEMAFKIYDETYNNSNPEASRIMLSHEKKMGLAVAYCDNDETTKRENFIGSMYMTQAAHNDMYKNADHFGLMILKDPDYSFPNSINTKSIAWVEVFPNPTSGVLTISSNNENFGFAELSVRSISGQLLKSESFNGASHAINISDLQSGVYMLTIRFKDSVYTKIIFKD